MLVMFLTVFLRMPVTILARMIAGILVVSLIGCGGTAKKEYAALSDIVPAIDITSLWVVKVGEKKQRQYSQLPITVSNGKVYTTNVDGNLSVLDQVSGKLLWQKSYDIAISSGPSYAAGVLYFGTNDAEVLAVSADNGEIQWRINVSSEVLANPTVGVNNVFIKTVDGKLFALNKLNGERVWVESNEVPALSLRGDSSPIVFDDKVIAGFANGKLMASEVATGKKTWETVVAVPSGRTDLQRMVDIDGLFQLSDDIIYVSSYQGRIAAVAADSGRAIWTRDMSSYSGVILDGAQLYVTDADGYVWCLDKKTGATLWRQDVLTGRDVSGPGVMSEALVVADGAGYIHWLSKEDGALIGRELLSRVYDFAFVDWGDEDRELRDLAVTAPLKVESNTLFVRDNEGALSVFKVSLLPAKSN
ncbi:MAG: outer membrane protein assembly factor BamB [Gammaproteobacteria bacterium]|nr:outer membrane protein assembly factor BamB [Gammaproteobacteria bacterium]